MSVHGHKYLLTNFEKLLIKQNDVSVTRIIIMEEYEFFWLLVFLVRIPGCKTHAVRTPGCNKPWL